MGTWGTGIKEDDVVCDVIGAFEDKLKDGATIVAATQAVLAEFSDALEDEDDAPQVWIGLAEAQWSFGELDHAVLDRVRRDYESGEGLSRWLEASDTEQRKRRRVLQGFVEKLSVPNTRPKRRPRRISRPPKFAPGDCLAIRLSNGLYGAGLVLASDHSNVEYGMNLIAVLDYMAAAQPDLRVFKRRRWLELTHHAWGGKPDISWYLAVHFKRERHRFELVGIIKIRNKDPKHSNSFDGWSSLGEQIVLQRSWDAGAR